MYKIVIKYLKNIIIGIYILVASMILYGDRHRIHRLRDTFKFTIEEKMSEVLYHYTYEEPNREKLDAACYIISHINDHYSVENIKITSPLIKSTYDYLDSVTKNKYFTSIKPFKTSLNKEFEINAETDEDFRFEEISDSLSTLLNEYKSENYYEKKILYDSSAISAQFLIDHIDTSFENWKIIGYKKKLNRDMFYETLLSYRFRNEFIDLKTSEIKFKLKKIVDPLRDTTLESIVNNINSYLFYIDCFENKKSKLGRLGFYDVLQFYNFECGRHSEWTAKALNAVGVPATMDFTPKWVDRDRGHFWVTVLNSSKNFIPFTPKWQALWDSSYFRKVSKVYRYKFATQIGPSIEVRNETVPAILDSRFISDVTDEYHSVTSIEVTNKSYPSDNIYAYLCIFGPNGWEPIGWGKRINKFVYKFKKVPKELTYIVCITNDNKLVPITYPFHLNRNSEITEIIPSKKKIDLTLERKFYEKDHLVKMMEETVGAELQVSDNSDFSDASTIHKISKENIGNMSLNLVPISNNRQAKYVRLVGHQKRYINISELRFFADSNGTIPLSTLPHYSNSNIGDAYDENIDTYVMTKSLKFEMIKPVTIKAIIIAPRTANNNVYPGDKYELFYYDDGWMSAGSKRSHGFKIIFNNIPANTLYWLKNLDHGIEEQAFQYSNGRQFFINHDIFQHPHKKSYVKSLVSVLE